MNLIRSGALVHFEELVRRFGENPHKLLKDSGLSSSLLRNPDALIPYTRVANLLDLASKICGDPLFSLKLAEEQPLTALGELAVAALVQSSLRESIEFANSHMWLHAKGLKISILEVGDSSHLTFCFNFTNSSSLQQLHLLSIGQLFNVITNFFDSSNFPVKMHLKRNYESKGLKRYSTKIRSNSSHTSIQLPIALLDKKIRAKDSFLINHFKDRMMSLREDYPDTLEVMVSNICMKMLTFGECSLQNISSALDMHPRVLQKKLNDEQSSYSKILKSTRIKVAKDLLRNTSMSITNISLNLGYSDTAIFSRNFKQWSSFTPRQWRLKELIP